MKQEDNVDDYYNDNIDLPVFKRGQVEYTVPDLMSMLLTVHKHNVCRTVPVGVEHSCSFLIDLKLQRFESR